MKLQDKVAIITGGSRGIGRAVARVFLREGAVAVLAARNTSELDKTVEELRNGGGTKVAGIRADVSNMEDVRNLFNKTLELYGTVDILVNAAGVQPPIGPFAESDVDEWTSNIRVNLFGTVLCCKHVLPAMISKKRGKIINFSGGGATSSRPYFSAYACAKTAVVKFTEVLAEEVRERGIHVNAVAPGAVNTRMLDEIIEAGEKAGSKEWQEALQRRDTGGTSPQAPADLVLFLASDASDGITGKLISAPWDPWQDAEFCRRLREDRDLGTLRRIDGKYYGVRR